MALPDYPLINGLRHDWSSIQLVINETIKPIGVKELSYKHSLEPGEVRGTHPQVLGHTLGTYSAEGSFTLYLEEYKEMIAQFGEGFLATVFNLTINYSPKKGDPVITDKLIGCRIKAADKSYSQGNEPLAVKCDLFVMLLIENGIKPLPNTLGA
jgi:hypothetical protein